jgi:drug/metabolite transporter (DMT)-like permease
VLPSSHPTRAIEFTPSLAALHDCKFSLTAIPSMIIMRVPIVIPTRWDWLAMLLVIGIFGFIAQVFLTMGLQREAAGRAALAIYIGVRAVFSRPREPHTAVRLFSSASVVSVC